MEGAEISQES